MRHSLAVTGRSAAGVPIAVVLCLVLGACTSTADGEGSAQTLSDSTTTTTDFVLETIPVPTTSDSLPTAWTEVHEPGVGGRLTSLAFDPNDPGVLLSGGDLLGIARSDDGGGHWTSTIGLENPEVGDITFDPRQPDRVWAGTMGGPHVSDDGGQTWKLSRVGMPPTDSDGYTAPVETVIFDPEVAGRLLALGGTQRRWRVAGEPALGAIWESTDDGNSWEQIATVGGGASIQAGDFLAGSGQEVVVVVEDGGVFRSGDGGRSWTESSAGLPHLNTTDLVTHPDDRDRVWVTLGIGPQNGSEYEPGGVYRSEDGGRTWELSGTGLTQFVWEDTLLTSSYETIVIAPSDPDRMYTADFSFRENFIYRSDDGGNEWVPVIGDDLEIVGVYSSGITAREMAVSPVDADTFVFSQDEYIMLSTDGGTTAADVTSDRTADGSFVGRGFSGLVATDIVFNPWIDGDATLLGFDGGNHIQTLDGFASYRRSIRGEDDYGGATRAVYAEDGGTVYTLLGQDNEFRGVGRSVDGGASFTVAVGASAGLPERDADVDETGLAVDPLDPDRVYVVIDEQLSVSDDGAVTFSRLGDIEAAHDVAIDDSTQRLFVSAQGGLFVSDDRGVSFDEVDGGPTDLKRVVFDPTEPGVILVVAGENEATALYRHRSGAEEGSWELLFEQPYLEMVAAHPLDVGTFVAVTQDLPFRDLVAATGVWASTDDGATWSQANEGLPMLRVSAVAFDPHQPDEIVVGTYGRGFYHASFEALVGAGRP